ncbi:MAG: hypothetical protein IJI14_15535 [Anaerolineaceae bacterium]|nr:hypothetical protein [Anaerolineaceae bacterium]
MKNTLPVISKNNALSGMAEKAVLDMIPIDQKTLQKIIKIIESGNLKRMAIGLAVGTAGGAALISLISTIGHDRMYQASVGREIKKQLEPLKVKLNELEAQNAVLYQQNQELTKLIEQMKDEKPEAENQG